MRAGNDSATKLGIATLAGGLLILGIVVVQAVARTSDEPAVEGSAPRSLEELDPIAAPTPGPRVGTSQLRVAAELAPFDPARQPPAERYRLPGEEVEEVEVVEVLPPAPAPPPPPPPPAFQVLGVAGDRSSGVAVIRIGTGTPQLVSLGQSIQGYRLSTIQGDRVQMEGGDGRSLSLAVATPSATPAAARSGNQRQQQQARPAQGNTTNTGGATGNNRAAPAATTTRTQPANGGNAGLMGLSPQELEAARAAGFDVQQNGNTVTVTGPNGQPIQIQRPAGGQGRATTTRGGGGQ